MNTIFKICAFEVDMEGSMQICHLFSVVAFEILYVLYYYCYLVAELKCVFVLYFHMNRQALSFKVDPSSSHLLYIRL